ncbi:pentatricopeptide repeat protein [Christiangramia gaetbulicola]|uniref:Pentatricopeptide repeat protein n=1 Tax=Christiangramia gaetbulicola TaxID=703340 RepID=A0A2T6ALA2_9FLAO|nr:tetratricopeptide repeat protein [Christiangramia gaetbulicola]PTX44589.1 pentatricopeptide repeat protein [Christiangramia gaetbulicola]
MITRIIFSLCFFSTFTLFPQKGNFQVADSLATVGKNTEAIELLKQTDPKTGKIYLRLAQIQKSIDQNDQALENYQKVLELNPALVLAAQEYGELLLESGKLDKADSLFSSLSEKYPDNAGFLYRIGLAKEKKKDSSAMDYFFKTVGLDSTHQAALYKTAKYELKHRKPHNAIHLSSTGLESRPNNASLLSILGQAYLATLQFEEAAKPFERLLELGEGSEFILERLASAYRRSGQTDKAIQIYNKMLEIDNMNGMVHTNLGVLHLKKDNTKKAQEHFMMALFIKNRPSDTEFLNLGLVYKRKEDFRSAYISFQKALEENPENERAMIELALTADGHFEDKQAVLELYQDFVVKYAEYGRKDMLSIAEYRISELKKEIHLSK